MILHLPPALIGKARRVGGQDPSLGRSQSGYPHLVAAVLMQEAFLIAMMLGAAGVQAAPDRSGIEVANPWVRATTPGQPTALAFVTLTSVAGDTLLSVSTPAAASAVLRQTLVKGGQVGVRQMSEGLTLGPQRPLALLPGGIDIMLSGLTAPLTAGDTIEVSFSFKRAGSITVAVPVRAADPARP